MDGVGSREVTYNFGGLFEKKLLCDNVKLNFIELSQNIKLNYY